MNLICFGGYTCGGILCDMLNLQSSPIGPGNNIKSNAHNFLKVNTLNYYTGTGSDCQDFYKKYEQLLNSNLSKNYFVGTHSWPGEIDTELFNTVINVTTETRFSKILRHARIFYTYFYGKFPQHISDEDVIANRVKPKILKTPATEFNQTWKSLHRKNILNLEFESLVTYDDNFKNTIYKLIPKTFEYHVENRIKVWREVNSFLYDERLNYIYKLWQEFKL